MLTEQTVDRLHHLRWAAMAEAYLAQQRDAAAASLSFDERLGTTLPSAKDVLHE